MNIKHKLAITSVIASVAMSISAAPVMAGSDHGRQSRFMSFFDTNNDNIVTLDELNTAAKERFNKMDADGNNVVTAEEFAAYLDNLKQDRVQQRFAAMDTNNDKQISKEEYVSYKVREAERRFQELDINNDQVVTEEEFAQHKHRRYSQFGEKKPHHYHGGGIFDKLDANHDGQLTLDESLNAWGNWFKRIDANNDQVVTLEEVQNYRKNMHNQQQDQ